MNLMEFNDVLTASDVARKAHDGQSYADGSYYELHLNQVAGMVTNAGYGYDYQVVAYLHDILEDTMLCEDDLLEMFPHYIVEAVVAITKYNDETYEEYMHRVVENQIARVVKYYDSLVNLATTARSKYDRNTLRRFKKYSRNLGMLVPFI